MSVRGRLREWRQPTRDGRKGSIVAGHRCGSATLAVDMVPTAVEGRGRSADVMISTAAQAAWTSAHRLGWLMKRFARANRASVTIEFAFLGLATFGLVLESMQTGLYFYDSTALERATINTTRKLKTGNTLAADQFRTTLCSFLPAGMSCANVITNINTATEDVYPKGYYSFVKSDQSGVVTPDMSGGSTSYCPGAPKAYVYAQVFYAMPAISPAWKAIASTLWKGTYVHFIPAAAVFRNEPYPTSSAPSAGGC